MHVVMFPDYRANNPYQGRLAEQLLTEGVKVGFPSGYKRGLHFSRILSSNDYKNLSILHLHWPDPYLKGKSALERRLYAWKLRMDLTYATRGTRQLAWTVHNLGRHDAGGDRVERGFYRWLAKKAAVLFVHDVSLVPAISQQLQVNPEKVTVIPHGHYADIYGPAPSRKEARKLLNLPAEERIVLSLGMLRPYKGLDELLDIWPGIFNSGVKSHLVIAGGGLDTEYIEHIRNRCKVLDGITLEARFVDDAEIPLFYGAADLAVLPFRAITTSGSLILALSYNCPVVTPRVPSISGNLEFQTELLYEAGSQKDLRRALLSGLAVDLNIWRPDFEHLKKVYSWERAAQLTAEAYRNCIHSGKK